MNKPTKIIKRDKLNEVRKHSKREWDNMINLSVKQSDGKTPFMLSAKASGAQEVRLLDEGMVMTSDNPPRPWFYIKKGVLQSFYDELSDDYVGSINLGHIYQLKQLFPLGTWTKKDLSLVDIGDGRKALNVMLRLDEDSVFVKELQRNDHTIGVSAEFPAVIDWVSTFRLGVEVVKSLTIEEFAIVGDAGNVNSGGIQLKGGTDNMALEKLTELATKMGLVKPKAEEKELGADNGHTDTVELSQTELSEMLDSVKELTQERDLAVQVAEEMDTRIEELTAKVTEFEGNKKKEDEKNSSTLTELQILLKKHGEKIDEKKEKELSRKPLVTKSSTYVADGLGV